MAYSEAQDIAEHNADIQRMMGHVNAYATFPVGVALDVGGGGGIHSSLLAPHVGRIYCTDFWDQNRRYGGEFVKLLCEKMERNGHLSPMGKLEFHTVDAMNMPYRENYFDLVVSFNAFEHIPDPAQALDEMIRVAKPGGLIYVTFDPIWTADSGSHFYYRVAEPWRHLLCDDDQYLKEMLAANATQGECDDYRTGMNRLRLAEHRAVFERRKEKVDFLVEQEWSGCSSPENREHPNFNACLAKGYSREELLLRGMVKLMRKNQTR